MQACRRYPTTLPPSSPVYTSRTAANTRAGRHDDSIYKCAYLPHRRPHHSTKHAITAQRFVSLLRRPPTAQHSVSRTRPKLLQCQSAGGPTRGTPQVPPGTNTYIEAPRVKHWRSPTRVGATDDAYSPRKPHARLAYASAQTERSHARAPSQHHCGHRQAHSAPRLTPHIATQAGATPLQYRTPPDTPGSAVPARAPGRSAHATRPVRAHAGTRPASARAAPQRAPAQQRTPRRARPRAGRRHCGRPCCARTPSSPQVRGRAERLQPRRILPPRPQKLPAAPAAPARAGHSLSTLDAWTSGLFFASRCRSIFL